MVEVISLIFFGVGVTAAFLCFRVWYAGSARLEVGCLATKLLLHNGSNIMVFFNNGWAWTNVVPYHVHSIRALQDVKKRKRMASGNIYISHPQIGALYKLFPRPII